MSSVKCRAFCLGLNVIEYHESSKTWLYKMRPLYWWPNLIVDYSSCSCRQVINSNDIMALEMGNIELMVKLQVSTNIHDQRVVHRQFTPDTR